jgi:hypothetical protein
MGFCCRKPKRPVPVTQPMVVATALPNATSINIVPWSRRSHRRNVAILAVVKRLAFIAIFPRRLTIDDYFASPSCRMLPHVSFKRGLSDLQDVAKALEGKRLLWPEGHREPEVLCRTEGKLCDKWPTA